MLLLLLWAAAAVAGCVLCSELQRHVQQIHLPVLLGTLGTLAQTVGLPFCFDAFSVTVYGLTRAAIATAYAMLLWPFVVQLLYEGQQQPHHAAAEQCGQCDMHSVSAYRRIAAF